jgi:ferritin-like metal-binding protein YciE
MKMTTDMGIKPFENLFFRKLEEMYDMECRMGKLLSDVATTASCGRLRKVALSHLLEIEDHVMKLERVFSSLDQRAKGMTSKITLGFIQEGGEIASAFVGRSCINTALISFLKKIGQFKIQVYQHLSEWASPTGNHVVINLIDDILTEEVSALQSLDELARMSNQQEASAAAEAKPLRQETRQGFLNMRGEKINFLSSWDVKWVMRPHF